MRVIDDSTQVFLRGSSRTIKLEFRNRKRLKNQCCHAPNRKMERKILPKGRLEDRKIKSNLSDSGVIQVTIEREYGNLKVDIGHRRPKTIPQDHIGEDNELSLA